MVYCVLKTVRLRVAKSCELAGLTIPRELLDKGALTAASCGFGGTAGSLLQSLCPSRHYALRALVNFKC